MTDTGPEEWRVAPGPADPERRIGYSSVVAGVDSLIRELAETRRAVEEDRSIRRLLVWFVAVALLTMLGVAVFGAVALNRLTDTQAENHKLLQTVERVTNPDAVARQQAGTGALVAQIIACVENHQNRLVDPSTPLMAGCTEAALPAPPAAPQPSPTATTTVPARVQSSAASRGAPRSGSCGGWEALVAAAGDWNVAEACSVMGCESHFDPLATNGRYKGLMQVDGGSLDGATNLAQAFALWAESRTWRRWSCLP